MSRVGKMPIDVPDKVDVEIKDKTITVSGPLGKLSTEFSPAVQVILQDQQIIVNAANNNNNTKARWGLYRSLINNLVIGTTEGFQKTLEIKGVGYRASLDNKFLTLFLGFSHQIKVAIPDSIEVKCPSQTQIDLLSIDKELLGKFAAEIRSLRPPEPYKGKGVKYKDEVIFRKEGKKK